MKYKPLGKVYHEDDSGGWIIVYILDDGHGHTVERREHELPDRQAAWIKKVA